jgi:hypothetical protein
VVLLLLLLLLLLGGGRGGGGGHSARTGAVRECGGGNGVMESVSESEGWVNGASRH